MQQLRIKVWVYDHTVFKTKEDAEDAKEYVALRHGGRQSGTIVSQIIKVDDYEVV